MRTACPRSMNVAQPRTALAQPLAGARASSAPLPASRTPAVAQPTPRGAVLRGTPRRGLIRRATTPDAVEAPSASAPGRHEACPAPLACPICLRAFSAPAGTSGRLTCTFCAREYPARDFCELTITGAGSGRYTEGPRPTATSLFQSPLISFAYERGWRQSFAWAGFPGADTEFEQAQSWLSPARRGVLLDVSCGSGLFTRRFAASGEYGHVIGADFSEAMLREAKALAGAAVAPGASPVTLVRADVARLPFPTASIDGVHAGAALHCWPSPSAALAEISRVLKPGGVFVASTFLDPTAYLGELVGDDTVLPLARVLGAQRTAAASYRWWAEPELRDLTIMVGLTGFERIRTRQFILLRVQKPAATDK